jgi:hypothetical protein
MSPEQKERLSTAVEELNVAVTKVYYLGGKDITFKILKEMLNQTRKLPLYPLAPENTHEDKPDRT